MKAFNQAASADDKDNAPDFAEKQKILRDSDYLINTYHAVGACLIGMMTHQKTTDQAVIDLFPESIYDAAVVLAEFQKHEAHRERRAKRNHDEYVGAFTIKELATTPSKKIWILAVPQVILCNNGLSIYGTMPGKETLFIDPERHLPSCQIPLAEKIHDELEETLKPFIDFGFERIKAYTGVTIDFPPIVLHDLCAYAQEKGHRMTEDINLWFNDAFDDFLVELHKNKASLNIPKAAYN